MTLGKTGILEIGVDAYAFIQEGGATNGGFVVGPEGVVVVEGLMTKALTQQVKAAVKKITKQPIRSVILTHFHGDHALGNQFYLPAHIIGHALCRDEFVKNWDNTIERFASRYDDSDPKQAAEFRNARMTPPDVVFHDERMTLYLGKRRIELLYIGKAHTRGDVLTYLPDEKVLYAGDVVTDGGAPFAADGYPSSWVSVLERVEAMDIRTIVPGHGPLGDKAMVSKERRFLAHARDEARKRYGIRMSVERASRDITISGFSAWTRSDEFPAIIQRLYMEFQGKL